MNIRYDQDKFLDNWNTISAILWKESKFKMPNLDQSGNCCGISFCLMEYLDRNNEEQFFELYHKICIANPRQLAKEISKYLKQKSHSSTSKELDELLQFIAKISILQLKQMKPVIQPENESERKSYLRERKTLGSNYTRINKNTVQDATIKLRSYLDIYALIRNMPANDRKILTLESSDNVGHALCVYRAVKPRVCYECADVIFESLEEAKEFNLEFHQEKKDILSIYNESFWVAFDSNDGKRRFFKNAMDLSQYLMKRSNLCFVPSSFSDKSDRLESFALSGDLSIATTTDYPQLNAGESELKPAKQTKNISSSTVRKAPVTLFPKEMIDTDKISEYIKSELLKDSCSEQMILKRLLGTNVQTKLKILEKIFLSIKNNTDAHPIYKKDKGSFLPSLIYNTSITQKQREHLSLLKKVYFKILRDMLLDHNVPQRIKQSAIDNVNCSDHLINYSLEFKGTTNTALLFKQLVSHLRMNNIIDDDKQIKRGRKQA